MKKLLFAVFAVLALAGCASTDYKQYAIGWQTTETARHNAEAERFKAIAAIASSGTETAKVAAVMALQRGGPDAQASTQLRAPEAAGDTALRWLGVLMPTVTQLGVTAMNVRAQNHQSDNATTLGLVQSNNATALGMSTNNAFSTIANGGFNALSTTSTAGFGALTSTAGAGFVSNSAVSSAGFASNSAIAGHIQAPAANVTTTNNTTSLTTDNHAMDSHNTASTTNNTTSTASTTSTDSHNSTATTSNTTSTVTSTTCSASGATSGSVTGTTTPTSGTGGSGTTNC